MKDAINDLVNFTPISYDCCILYYLDRPTDFHTTLQPIIIYKDRPCHGQAQSKASPATETAAAGGI